MKNQKLCLAPAVLTFVLFSGCAFHWKGKIPDYKEEIYTVDTPEALEEISLQEQDIPVEILPSADGQLSISYFLPDDESESYRIDQTSDTLTFTKVGVPNQGIFVFGDEGDSDARKNVKLTLYLPDTYTGTVTIETTDSGILVGKLPVNCINIQAGDGTVTFHENIIGQSLDCRTKDGDITGTLAGKTADYTFRLHTSSSFCLTDWESGEKTIDLGTADRDITLSFSE